MKKIFFTVGPSQVYPTLDKHVRTALAEQVLSMSHRGKDFQSMYERVETKLKNLLNIPDEYSIFFIGSSVEAMERIIQNTVEKTSFHFVNGAFSKKAAGIAEELQKEVIKVEVSEGEGFDIKKVNIPSRAELIFITENDTSTGIIFPHDDVYLLRKQHPNKLIAVDLVSSAPYSPINFSMIDIAFFSGQKGLGLPSGMSILVVSPQAMQKSYDLQKKGVMIGSYHNFPTLQKNRESWQTPETPNVLVIYLLEKVLDDMLEVGIEKIRKSIDQKAKILYAFFEHSKKFRTFIKNKSLQSPSTLVIEVPGGSKPLREQLSKKGIIVGSGYGKYKDEHIRIANFPAHTKLQIRNLIMALRHSGEEHSDDSRI